MIETVVRRLLLSIPVLVGVLILGFTLVQLSPSDPAQVRAGPTATPDVIAKVREEMGLNDSLIVQFGRYVVRLVHGDLGRSMISNRAVTTELKQAIIPSLELLFACLVWSIPLGIAMGTAAAVWQGSYFDRAIMAISVAGLSLPIFFICLVLIEFLGIKYPIFPFMGRGGPLWSVPGLRHIVLPAVSLGLLFIGPVARMTRSSVLETMRLDHVRTARSKGLSELQVTLRHSLRNSLLPVTTLIGLLAGYLIGGAVVTETIFSYPGIGRLAVGAIMSADFPMAQGTIMVLALGFIFINLCVDILYLWLDPRMRD